MLIAHYVIGFPIGVLMAFKVDLKIKGFWIGNLISLSMQALFFLKVIMSADWQEIADRTA